MNYLLFLIFVTLVPALIGVNVISDDDGKPYIPVSRWTSGFLIMMALVYLPAVIGIILGWTLTLLTVIWMLLLLVLMIRGVILIRKNGEHPLGETLTMIRTGNLLEAAAFLLPAAHAVVTFFMMHVDDDDIHYVGAVTTSVDTNTLMKYDAVTGNLIRNFARNEMNRLASSPQFAFYAMISKTFSIRPTVLCHTLIPPVLTMLFFAAFLMVGRELYPEDRKKSAVFLIFVFLVSVSSYFSVYTAGTFMLIRSWQGKAQIVGLAFPLLFALSLRILKKGDVRLQEAVYYSAIIAAACLMTSMGAIFVSGAGALLMLLASIMRRNRRIFLRTLPAYLIPIIMLAFYYSL